MKTFTLTLVSDSKIIYSGLAGYCNVRTLNGEIGFEAFHEPFLGILAEDSRISYRDKSGNQGTVDIKSGIILFENNLCTITVSLQES